MNYCIYFVIVSFLIFMTGADVEALFSLLAEFTLNVYSQCSLY